MTHIIVDIIVYHGYHRFVILCDRKLLP